MHHHLKGDPATVPGFPSLMPDYLSIPRRGTEATVHYPGPRIRGPTTSTFTLRPPELALTGIVSRSRVLGTRAPPINAMTGHITALVDSGRIPDIRELLDPARVAPYELHACSSGLHDRTLPSVTRARPLRGDSCLGAPAPTGPVRGIALPRKVRPGPVGVGGEGRSVGRSYRITYWTDSALNLTNSSHSLSWVAQ